MAAPQIPNLNTLRATRGAGRGYGHSRGGHGISNSHISEGEKSARDRVVQQTDQDASVSRLSAVEVGYLHDPFAQDFVIGGPQRRFPIINRGTYVRTIAIDSLVDRFLSQNPSRRKQIISLGAGSDTRFFRLMSRSAGPSLVYHELDFPANTRHKIAAIKRSPTLTQCLGSGLEIAPDGSSLSSSNYHIHALDLRTLYPSSPTTLPTLDASLPTLLISECCLIYLPPSAADAVISHFSTLFPPSTPLGLIVYEPINPFDAFGKVMVANLAARGIVMQTLHRYGSLEAQKERLRMYGFGGGREAKDVGALWERWVGGEEKERVAGLEMVDEVEEWELLAGHYCVAWGWKGGAGEGEEVWLGWKGLPG
ncbi:S-adenosyl-L-methionine-dependent methyltransferase-like [Lasallia pustulata]|uniref:Leucine carboxyl methyltransferase 1 n=1 Tax=Lasallia pustulata TaxID=136370 RepID=A0A1W5D812_9LECA|nr:S-adenosyl-L-methionine-dependent methyltransferase-like [Lasallia pustulata]